MSADLIRLKYFKNVKNIGDVVSPLIVEHISGKNITSKARKNSSHLISLGSMIQTADTNSYVWGTGYIGQSLVDPNILLTNISCLRGDLTRDYIHSINGKKEAVDHMPLGDPGLFIPEIFPPSSIKTPDLVGVIPHYSDFNSPKLKKILSSNQFIFINVFDSPKIFFEKLTRCSFIISSSLHGLIFADSFNIPNIWAGFHGRLAGGYFKFYDYYSTTFLPKSIVDANSHIFNLSFIKENAYVSRYKYNLDVLRSSFPSIVFEDSKNLEERPEDFVNLSLCRSINFGILTDIPFQCDDESFNISYVDEISGSLIRIHNDFLDKFNSWAECPNLLVTNFKDLEVLNSIIRLATIKLNTIPNARHYLIKISDQFTGMDIKWNEIRVENIELKKGDYFIYFSKPERMAKNSKINIMID